MSTLDQLRACGTTIVCDSGDFNVVRKYRPQDSTTNPSLILAAAQKSEYAGLLKVAVEHGIETEQGIDKQVDAAFDRLLVEFGQELLKIVPGKVSTEVDARLSFDTVASIEKARKLIQMYEEKGIDKSRVLIKLASTWEGIKAAETLQQEGINCNLTLLFSLVQAIAAAEAGAFLISPFVGRIMDWYKAKTGQTYSGVDDPGVKSVTSIFQYYKKFNYKTIVMGASFRNTSEVISLAGCDYLTISPNLLEELYNSQVLITKALDATSASNIAVQKFEYLRDEAKFRFNFNEDAMAVEKLREGISKFSADADILKEMLKGLIVKHGQ